LAAVLLGLAAANHHPEFRASFVATNPSLGVPISVAGVPATEPDDRRPPPITAEFGQLALTRIQKGSDHGTVLIDVTIESSDCPELLERFGGRCGDRSVPVRASDEVELSFARPGGKMFADFWLLDKGWVRLTQSGALTEQGIPTAWNLESGAPTMRVDISCGDSTLLISARHTERVQCAYGGVHYTLPIRSEEDILASLFLREVTSLNAGVAGVSAGMEVGEGDLAREGEFETLQSAKPLAVSLTGSEDDLVDLTVSSQADAGAFDLTMSVERARGIEWEDNDHTRSLLDRYSELGYALLGVIAGFFLVAVTDFGFASFILRK
jgi:hypothetical protein